MCTLGDAADVNPVIKFMRHALQISSLMMISWWSKHVRVVLSVLMCDIWINVLLQTSAFVGPLYIVNWNARWNSEKKAMCFLWSRTSLFKYNSYELHASENWHLSQFRISGIKRDTTCTSIWDNGTNDRPSRLGLVMWAGAVRNTKNYCGTAQKEKWCWESESEWRICHRFPFVLQRTGEEKEKDILEAAIGQTEKVSHDVDVGCGCWKGTGDEPWKATFLFVAKRRTNSLFSWQIPNCKRTLLQLIPRLTSLYCS
jgi:hypothetical protein